VDDLLVGGFGFTVGAGARDLRVFSGDMVLSGTDIMEGRKRGNSVDGDGEQAEPVRGRLRDHPSQHDTTHTAEPRRRVRPHDSIFYGFYGF
jgi:hypothetical protein